MVANSRKKHWGQTMGGTKTTMDDLRAAVKANITATFDITANGKDRVNVCIHTHKCTYRYTGKYGSKSDMIDHIAQ